MSDQWWEWMDWNSERFVTFIELEEMPRWEARLILDQPNRWRCDIHRDVLVNVAHPDNEEWALARDRIAQERSHGEFS